MPTVVEFKRNGDMKREEIEAKIRRGIRDAAERGEPNAIYEWGNMFHYGMFGMRKCVDTSAILYRLAALRGHACAGLKWALCCYYGCGTKRNLVEAARWFAKSCKAGLKGCWFLLGNCYKNTGHSKKAMAAYEKAIRFDADEIEKIRNLLNRYNIVDETELDSLKKENERLEKAKANVHIAI